MLGYARAFSLNMFSDFLETDRDYEYLREPVLSVWPCNPSLLNILKNWHFYELQFGKYFW